MNQDKKVKPGMEKRMPEANPPAPKNAPPNAAPPAGSAAKIEVDPVLLSLSLARDLSRTPREEWHKIESVFCRVGFTRDMADGVRFVDAVANVVNQKGGLFSSPNLDRRRYLEQCSEAIVAAFRAFLKTTAQVARTLQLTNILERYWRLLSTYNNPPKKADGVKAAQKPGAAKEARDPAGVA